MKKRCSYVFGMGAVFVIVAPFFSGWQALGAAKDDKPSIAITSVPTDPPGENTASEPVRGTVTRGNSKEQKVVLYALGGDVWWVQPLATTPDINFGDDGKWESQTHGGTEFAALLVKSSYKPQAKLSTIPTTGGDVLAVAKKKPEKKDQ